VCPLLATIWLAYLLPDWYAFFAGWCVCLKDSILPFARACTCLGPPTQKQLARPDFGPSAVQSSLGAQSLWTLAEFSRCRSLTASCASDLSLARTAATGPCSSSQCHWKVIPPTASACASATCSSCRPPCEQLSAPQRSDLQSEWTFASSKSPLSRRH
jgi:hypothetical protein